MQEALTVTITGTGFVGTGENRIRCDRGDAASRSCPTLRSSPSRRPASRRRANHRCDHSGGGQSTGGGKPVRRAMVPFTTVTAVEPNVGSDGGGTTATITGDRASRKSYQGGLWSRQRRHLQGGVRDRGPTAVSPGGMPWRPRHHRYRNWGVQSVVARRPVHLEGMRLLDPGKRAGASQNLYRQISRTRSAYHGPKCAQQDTGVRPADGTVTYKLSKSAHLVEGKVVAPQTPATAGVPGRRSSPLRPNQ